MKDSETVTGIVLSVMPIGEYDRRMSILTMEHGKISAFAKGARKSNSALLACTQPFTFGEFSIYVGKNSYTVINVEVKKYFEELRNDLELIYYGLYMCEFCDYYTIEGDDETEMLKLLYYSLFSLSNKAIGTELVKSIFDIKMIMLNGEGPQVNGCVRCGKNEELAYFSVRRGGVLCESCAKDCDDAVHIDTSTLYCMQHISLSRTEKLYTFTLSEAILKQFTHIVNEYKKYYVNHEIKSEEMINTVKMT